MPTHNPYKKVQALENKAANTAFRIWKKILKDEYPSFMKRFNITELTLSNGTISNDEGGSDPFWNATSIPKDAQFDAEGNHIWDTLYNSQILSPHSLIHKHFPSSSEGLNTPTVTLKLKPNGKVNITWHAEWPRLKEN